MLTSSVVDHCNEEVRKRQARRAALAPLLMQESSAKSRPEPEAPTVASTHPLMESENVGPTAPPQPETSGVTTQPTPTRDQLYSMVYPKIKCRSHWRQNLGEHFAPRCYFGSEGEDCIVCRITDAVHAAEGVGGEVEDARVFTRSILSEDGEDLVQDWNESVLKKFDYAVPDKVGKHHIVEHFLRRQNDVEVLDYPDFDELFGLNAPEEAVTKAVQDNLDQPQIPGLAMSQGTTAAAPQSLTTSHTEPKPGSTRETRSANSSVKELAKRMADDKHKRKRSSPPAYPATRGLCEYVNPGKRAAFDHQGASEQV